MQNPTPWNPPYELVAQISKTKGLSGQLVAQELGELSVLRLGLEVWVVPPPLEGVRHTVITELAANQQKPGVLLSLEGVTNRDEANELAGRYLLARISPDSQDQAQTIAQDGTESLSQDQGQVALGTTFIDSAYGSLGQLISINPGPAYDIWVVEGSYGHLEIPAVDEYLVQEDGGTNTVVHLALPPGFIEITGR